MYDRPMEGWYGPMMSAVSDEFAQLDGNFGYKLETPPMHAGLLGLATPWRSGQQYKQDVLGASQAGTFIVLTRDRFGGEIKLSKSGQPLVHYRLNPYDKRHLLHGIAEGFKIHAAAGARQVRLLHNDGDVWHHDRESVDRFVKRIPEKSWATNRFILFSAHQMGTCRMGGGNRRHPVKPNGETREVKQLFVADASAFPRCSGVNPMLSIQALAHYIAKGML
jgi:choline dehydrogenase-like flavoprotein